MSANAVETARKRGELWREKCSNQTRVTKSPPTPNRPECGNDSFEARNCETE